MRENKAGFGFFFKGIPSQSCSESKSWLSDLVQGCGLSLQLWTFVSPRGFAGIAAAGAAWCGHTVQPQGVLQHPWDLGALKPSSALSSCSLRGSVKSVISEECRQGLCCYLWRKFLLLESFKLFFLPKIKEKNQREKKKSSLPSGHNLVQYVTFQTVRKFLWSGYNLSTAYRSLT